MSAGVQEGGVGAFKLTPKQRRLRVATFLILASIIAMIAFGVSSDFFRPSHHGALTRHMRDALAVKALFIAGYWTICFLLASSLIVMAWLDVREVRRKLAIARRDFWRHTADEWRKRGQTGGPSGEEHGGPA